MHFIEITHPNPIFTLKFMQLHNLIALCIVKLNVILMLKCQVTSRAANMNYANIKRGLKWEKILRKLPY